MRDIALGRPSRFNRIDITKNGKREGIISSAQRDNASRQLVNTDSDANINAPSAASAQRSVTLFFNTEKPPSAAIIVLQAMFQRIDLYRLEVYALKNILNTAEALAEAFELPADALLGAARVTVTARKNVVIENHRGILSYGEESIVIRLQRGKLAINGSALHLVAMTADRVFITGRIQSMEWE